MATRRKAPKGTFWRGGVLWGRMQVKGRDVRWSLRTSDPEAAKRRLQEDREKTIAAVHYGEVRRPLASVIDSWGTHISSHLAPQTVRRYTVSLAALKSFLEGKYLDEINSALITEIIRERQARRVTNATIRRDLVAISSIIGFSQDQGWMEDNPVLPKLKRVKEKRDPIVLPDAGHIQCVIAEAPPMFAKLIEAAWATGCRLDELVFAKHSNLDHQRKQLTVIGKGNKLRVVDISESYDRVFARLPVKLGCQYLFWHHNGQPYHSATSRFREVMARVQKLAQGVPRFRFHDLRHRHAVDWLKKGRSIYDLQQRLGHTSVKTTEIYIVYLTPDEKRTAMYGAHQMAQKSEQG